MLGVVTKHFELLLDLAHTLMLKMGSKSGICNQKVTSFLSELDFRVQSASLPFDSFEYGLIYALQISNPNDIAQSSLLEFPYVFVSVTFLILVFLLTVSIQFLKFQKVLYHFYTALAALLTL